MMRIDENGIFHFDSGGEVGIFSTPYVGLPAFIGTGQQTIPSDSGGPPNAEIGGFASEEAYIAQLAAIHGEDIPTATKRYFTSLGLPVPVTTPASNLPAGFTSQDILDYFNTPGLTPQEAVRTMQQYNVQPEDIASILGLTPEEARSQYANAMFQSTTTPVATPTTAPVLPVFTPPPTGGTGILGGLADVARAVGTQIDNVVGPIINAAGQFLFKSAPSLVVLNPVNPSATVVFGTPTGGTTPIIVGNMPSSGAPVGVATGIPLLDSVFAKIFSKQAPGQSGPDLRTVIKETVLETVGEQLGIDGLDKVFDTTQTSGFDLEGAVEALHDVVLGFNDQITTFDAENPNINVATDPTTAPTTAPIDTDVTDPFPLEPGGTTTGSETDGIIDLIGGADPNIGPKPNYSLQEILDYIDSTAMQDGIITDEEAREIARTAVTNNVSPERIAAATGEDIDKVLSYFPGGSNYIDPNAPKPTVTQEPTVTQRPTEPTVTQRPTEPTVTQRPTEPTVTQRPTEPTVTQRPTEPTVTQRPTEPTVTQRPTEPTVTQRPTEPTVTQRPIEPTVTQRPTEPTVTQQPTEPTVTQRPTEPTVTQRPTEPTVTQRPTEPTVTQRPTEPTVIQEPTSPTAIQEPTVSTVAPPRIPPVPRITAPQQQQSMRVEGTEKAGLAEIDPQFDLSASLLDNLLRILSSEDDNGTGVPYYSGGKVAPHANIDEIIRLLRG